MLRPALTEKAAYLPVDEDRPSWGEEGRHAMVAVRRFPLERDADEVAVMLDELAREGARRMIAAALQAEADEYVASFVDEVDEDGRRLVRRNGTARSGA